MFNWAYIQYCELDNRGFSTHLMYVKCKWMWMDLVKAQRSMPIIEDIGPFDISDE